MVEQQNPNSNQTQTVKKDKGLVSKIFAGVSLWIGSLLGKKPVQSQNESTQTASAVPQQQVSEDSVAQDIQDFKKFLGKVSGKVSSSVSPTIAKGRVSAASSVGQIVDTGFLKKIVRIFLIVFFLMIVIYIGIRLFSELNKNGGDGISPEGITSTPIPYQPYKPSVYAEDPTTLRLEEEINVIERELSSVNLRESLLTPPSLDFEVSF